MAWTTKVQFSEGTEILSLRHRIQIYSQTHSTSYSRVAGGGGSFRGDKAAGSWIWPPTSGA